MRYKIFTDGGARGNPGPAGAGVQVLAVLEAGENGVGRGAVDDAAVIGDVMAGSVAAGSLAADSLAEGERQSVIYEQASYLGRATNNEAEYKAFLAALEWLRDKLVLVAENGKSGNGDSEAKSVSGMVRKAEFYLDSKLVVEQVLKNWKIKELRLRKLAEKAWELMAELEKLGVELSLKHVARENNKGADGLVNRALDAA